MTGDVPRSDLSHEPENTIFSIKNNDIDSIAVRLVGAWGKDFRTRVRIQTITHRSAARFAAPSSSSFKRCASNERSAQP